MPTRGGERNSSDEKLNKQWVMSTSQYVLFIMNPNKLNVAKLGDTSGVSPLRKIVYYEVTVLIYILYFDYRRTTFTAWH